MTNIKHLNIEIIDPEADLKDKVFQKIEAAAHAYELKRKITGFSVLFASCGALIFFIIDTIAESEYSGFSTYLSLIFTDGRLILNNWSEFSLALVDSIPFFQITMILAVIVLFLISLRYIANSKNTLFHSLSIKV